MTERQNKAIDYVEFPARDMSATKTFFQNLMQWDFVDYGPEYMSFSDEKVDGGFFLSDSRARQDEGSALVVFYFNDLEATQQQIKALGGTISKPIFDFPGGRRFHFLDPNGNEFAVWSQR